MSSLFVVSNRLPVARNADGALVPSSGGLASALNSIRSDVAFTWFGAQESAGAEKDAAAATELAVLGYKPVFIDAATYEQFYSVFSNSVLWPILHYSSATRSLDAPAIEDAYAAYVRANVAFCTAIVAAWTPGVDVWVHDYHLCLLPELLRAALPTARIGFFLQ